MKDYLDAIHRHVCTACRHAVLDDVGRVAVCTIPLEQPCTLMAHLPHVVALVESFEKASYADCLVQLRCQVCSRCPQFRLGSCPLTGVGDCTLERSFAMVVDVINSSKTEVWNSGLEYGENKSMSVEQD